MSEEIRSIFNLLFLLIPASFYIMGLMEGKKGNFFFILAVLMHLAGIGIRWVEIGSIPLSEKRDNISFMAFSTAIIYLYFYRTRAVKEMAVAAMPLISLILLAATLYEPVNTISPFLKSPWFYIHIFFYFISYAFFGISLCAGIDCLQGKGLEQEIYQYKTAAYGWAMLSIALVSGSIWFFLAYGTYWLWTSKELWSALVWFYYGLYLHVRLIRGLKGRPAIVLGCAGFGLALFAYFGIGTIIPSPPTEF